MLLGNRTCGEEPSRFEIFYYLLVSSLQILLFIINYHFSIFELKLIGEIR